MTSPRQLSPAFVLITALGALSFATGCPPNTCTLNDEVYALGETFDAPDGCNECVCGEGGAIACTEIGCSNEPEGVPDGGNEPDVVTDAGNEPDVVVDGGQDAGALDGGAEDAGFDAGAFDGGLDDAGFDAGERDAGERDGGAFDGGAFDGGAFDAGPNDAGPEPLHECVQIGQFNDNLGQCVCGTDSERPIDEEQPNNFECGFGQCVDNCCSPGDMVDPNDITQCVPKAAPYIQFFALAPVDDIFHYRGYAPGADSCVVTGTFANEAPYTQTFDTAASWANAYPGTGQLFSVPMDRNRFLYGGTMEVDCTGEFGSVGQTIVIPPADERYSMNIEYDNGVFEFCVDRSHFPIFANCSAVMAQNVPFDECFAPDPSCRASAYVLEPESGCSQADYINAPPSDGDFVKWQCIIEEAQNDVLRSPFSIVFNYDAETGLLILNDAETDQLTYE